MASNWKKTTFEESAIDILDGDRGKNYPKKSEFTEFGYCLFLNTGNVTKDGFKFSSTEFVSSERDQLLRKGKLQRKDVVLTTRGTVGNVAYYDSSIPFNHIRINSGMVILRSDDTKILPRYLYLFLRSKLFENQVSALQSGSAQPQLPIRDIKRVEIKVPPLPEQKAIAHILGTLDDKIELNRQMNETLEAMAQALFKSWFVDFDPVIDNALAAGNAIPDEFMERAEQRKGIEKKDNSDIQKLFPDEFEFTEEMGWIPKGWENGTLADICSYGKGKINTSEITLENYISTENMNKEKSGISHAANIASTNQVPKFSVGQTLISNIRPYFKKIWLARFGGGRSNDVLGFQANDAVANEYLFSLLYQDSFFDYMTATSKGTKMPRGDKAAIMSWSVAIPPLILMEDFSNKVKPMYLANHIRSTQAISLSKIRDTLLPKLMSGELRIPDAEVLVEDI